MFSIIIPAYLPKKKNIYLLDRCLNSIKNQTFKDYDVTIVFNGTDEIIYESFVKKWSLENIKINFLYFSDKKSAAEARNIGINYCNREWISLCDSDDFFHKEKLEKQFNFIKNNNHDFVGTLAWDFYSNNDIRESCFKPGQYETNYQISKVIFKENVLCCGSMIFKKSIFNNLKGFKHHRKPGEFWPEYNKIMNEDWDLWIRAIKFGYTFYNIPERLYYWSVNTSVER